MESLIKKVEMGGEILDSGDVYSFAKVTMVFEKDFFNEYKLEGLFGSEGSGGVKSSMVGLVEKVLNAAEDTGIEHFNKIELSPAFHTKFYFAEDIIGKNSGIPGTINSVSFTKTKYKRKMTLIVEFNVESWNNDDFEHFGKLSGTEVDVSWAGPKSS